MLMIHADHKIAVCQLSNRWCTRRVQNISKYATQVHLLRHVLQAYQR
jgi:hypothetical protein